MPVPMRPIRGGVVIDWYGDVWKRRVQEALRGALTETGEAVVTVAKELVRNPENAVSPNTTSTGNLQANIEARVPRRVGGTRTYRLEVGVFEDSKGPQLRDQLAYEYAYWQEVLPEPWGKPYLRPALDREGRAEQIRARLTALLGYKRGGLAADPRGATISPSEQGTRQIVILGRGYDVTGVNEGPDPRNLFGGYGE